MELNESSRLYLADYYVLEQVRADTNRFLEEVATRLFQAVQDERNKKDDRAIVFDVWPQKGGGHVEFYIDKPNIPTVEGLGEWKFSAVYRDAIKAESLTDTTNCCVYGFTPKNNSIQRREVQRVAAVLGLPDPYACDEYSLLGVPLGDVVDSLASAMLGKMDNFEHIATKLVEECIR